VLRKPARDQRPSFRGQFNLPNAPVARVIVARDEAFFDQPIDCHADRARREPNFRAKSVHRERSFVKERLEDAKIRVAQLRSLDALGGVGHHSVESLHENEPEVNAAGVLRSTGWFWFHENYLLTPIILISIYFISNKDITMKITSVIARFLLGLIFLVFGLNGFLNFIPMPPPTGVAGQFMGALFVSHFLIVIFVIQLIGAGLLLVNRYVPLALTLLAPIIVNILLFHLLMAPSGIPLAIIVTVLWVLVFLSVRSAFTGLLLQRAPAQALQ
jgi:putative oxidoreductase